MTAETEHCRFRHDNKLQQPQGVRIISRFASPSTSLLRVPPFPGARAAALATRSTDRQSITDEEVDRLIGRAASLKAVGSFWAAQPPLPAEPYSVVRVADREARKRAIEAAGSPVLTWGDTGAPADIAGECDPWHILSGAAQVILDADDELAIIAGMARVPLQCVGDGRFSSIRIADRSTIRDAFRATVVDNVSYADPFSGAEIGVGDAIELCGFWRSLVDSNRGISAAVGFAFWKRETVAPLLWGGTREVPFASARRPFARGDTVAVWKSRTPPHALKRLEESGAKLVEVEDGFVRSAGLGAECVPPLSIVVDSTGIYFDPRRPSDLELLLEKAVFTDDVLERAQRLRELIVERGISKYAAGIRQTERRSGGKRQLLVPGQVEDDRSIVCGGGTVTSNLELLRRVRKDAPDAHIIYKPHPDVEAGHRTGAIPDQLCLSIADAIVRHEPISSLIAAADEVHVNTSLAGFEALLRSKPVTTYGVPFFAGWGLTRDLGPVPRRRTAITTLDELVAAALLLYPRYVDPVTGLPCPPEVLLERLSEGGTNKATGTLVRLRRLQGQLKRAASALRSW